MRKTIISKWGYFKNTILIPWNKLCKCQAQIGILKKEKKREKETEKKRKQVSKNRFW